MADDKKKADDTAVESTEEAPKAAAKKTPAKKAPAKAAATEAAATEAAAAEEKPKATRKPATKKADAEEPKAAAKGSATTEGAGGTLKVHHLRPAPGAKTAKTRVGRGEASKGKTAGRGTKGSKARYQVPEAFEGGQMPMHMRLPKLRGFKNPFRVEYQVVNLDKISALYPQGGDVTVADLVAKGAVRKGQPVKVLGTGELTVKVSLAVDAYSASAKEKIEAAGGSVAQG
ncbi:50S ribosomal protein L15 [Cellulomonas shaoxiangyii]|uniref:Large ribosomal subunit protein uL15 n=1 Tax=Cellulomonas shaoxiangyii TaxID=2566013 RepID=A0A4P7SLR1_9CELL|nr:50S ribosomal protein L15 [Cellulomonas shaoxiangyii]QCB95180.1 50S ribosomal protein L15 [Cellulomonas shaoxiangyii]TGY85425.1 50S ribosomal protein L15 [Cellulomonas shaoxiangyii]